MKLKQLLLLSILLFSSTILPMAGARAQLFKWLPRIATGTTLAVSCGLPAYDEIQKIYSQQDQRRNPNDQKTIEAVIKEYGPGLTKAPKVVEHFVRQKLDDHQIENPQDLNILMVPYMGSPVSVPPHWHKLSGIMFEKEYAIKLETALKILNNSSRYFWQKEVQPDEKNKALQTVKVQNALLDHEIGHLKDHYCRNREYYEVCMPFITNSGIEIVKKAISRGPAQTLPQLIARYCLPIIPSIWIRIKLNNQLKQAFSRKLERNADNYAITCSKDPESLRLYANFIENVGMERIKWFLDDDDLIKAKNYAHLSIIGKTILKLKYFFAIQADDFAEATHPFELTRAATCRKAALALEEQQKNQNNKI